MSSDSTGSIDAVAPRIGLRAFEDVAVGDDLPERTYELTRGDLVNYSGVSGDPNPIHWSDPVARSLAGLPEVVAHGMLTMGLGAGFVTDWSGDPGAITEYNVRFTSPVLVKETEPAKVDFTGRIKSMDEETRTAVVAITAKFEGKKIFGRATATVRLG